MQRQGVCIYVIVIHIQYVCHPVFQEDSITGVVIKFLLISNQTNLFWFTANCALDVLALERLLFPFQITKLKSLKHHSFAIIFLIASCFLQKTFLKFFHHSKQKNSSFKVTSLPVGQTIKLISQTFEHCVKFCISQMSFQIAPIYITWQSIIGCHQQM